MKNVFKDRESFYAGLQLSSHKNHKAYLKFPLGFGTF